MRIVQWIGGVGERDEWKGQLTDMMFHFTFTHVSDSNQVSRFIGDMYLKKPELQPVYPISLKRPVISAEPSINVRKLKPEDSFLIFASDGLWEGLSDDEAANIVSRSPIAGVAKRLINVALIQFFGLEHVPLR